MVNRFESLSFMINHLRHLNKMTLNSNYYFVIENNLFTTIFNIDIGQQYFLSDTYKNDKI